MAPVSQNFVFVVGTEKDAKNKSSKNHLSAINKHIALHRHGQRRKSQKQVKRETTLDDSTQSSSAGSSPSEEIAGGENSSPDTHDGVRQQRGQSSSDQHRLTQADGIQPNEWFGDENYSRANENRASHDQALEHWYQNDRGGHRRSSTATSVVLRRPSFRNEEPRSPSPGSGLQSFLDPFFRLPVQLSEYERSLVHFYFTYVPVASLGLKADGPFCPLRTWISDLAQEYPSIVQWILTSSEDYISSMGAKPDQESSMVKRKADAYQFLRRAISHSDSDPDHALAGMMMAAASDEKNSKVHLKGLEKLIQSNGGNKAFGKAFKLMHPDFFIMTYSFAPCIILSLQELQLSTTSFIRNLTAMNARSHWLYAEKLQRPSLGEFQGAGEYLDALDEMLQCECSGPLMCSEYDRSLPYIRRARHFTMLFNFHKVLLCFEEDGFQQQILFLKKLRQFCRESSAKEARTGMWLLRPGAVVSVICHARKYVLQRFLNDQEAFTAGVATSRATVEGLKVFGYLSEESQEFVVTTLRAWVLQNFTSTEEWSTRTAGIDALSAEINERWLNEQISTKVEGLALCR